MQDFSQPSELRIRKSGANYTVEANGFDLEEFAQVLAVRLQAHIWEVLDLLQDKKSLALLIKRILEEG